MVARTNEDRDAVAAAVAALSPPVRPARVAESPLPAGSRTEETFGVRRVVLSGIPAMPLGVLKRQLQVLRIQTSQILNASYVGPHTVEFTVKAAYSPQFLRLVVAALPRARHLPAYDPLSSPTNRAPPASERDQRRAAFARRVERDLRTTSRPEVGEFLRAWAAELEVVLREEACVSRARSQDREMAEANDGPSETEGAAGVAPSAPR